MMRSFKKKYIVNERNEKVAVQLDIKIFEKIERVLEDALIANKMIENKTADRLSMAEAREFYFEQQRLKDSKEH